MENFPREAAKGRGVKALLVWPVKITLFAASLTKTLLTINNKHFHCEKELFY